MLKLPLIAEPWGKTDKIATHHLAHHCADTAATFEALAALPVIRARLEHAAGQPLSETMLARLTVITFLHDAGKLHPGFQAKGWPELPPGVYRRGHVQEGAAIFASPHLNEIAEHLLRDHLLDWGADTLLLCAISHHGRPAQVTSAGENGWREVPAYSYSPVVAAETLGRQVRQWFPKAFEEDGQQLPATPRFQHLYCGLVSLADWIASNRKIFAFIGELDPDYIKVARARARTALAGIQLDTQHLRDAITGRTSFFDLTGFQTPRPQQQLVGAHDLRDPLLILEAETGAGKTEAALWRFAQLFEAGLVDSLYFALPTRAAAIQIHRRINSAMKNLFREHAPEAVLAVPGYIWAGVARAEALPDWTVRWDDDADDGQLLARWAAENAKRYLAAAVAVGTVDQALLAALRVKHAHLRAGSLSRSLLVIDEVHASDSYMTGVLSKLLDIHLGNGGHAMLMSATLGASARIRWLGQRQMPSFSEAIAAPYPALWGKTSPAPRGADQEHQKCVAMHAISTMAAEAAAHLAIEAARAGARVLIIRNTVKAAISTWQAVRDAGGEALLLSVNKRPTLHHSRFAQEDRGLLDKAVEEALSPKSRMTGGVIVIGTQTLEQSLDIDADILFTDLCPIDVLLQRIGRLHRHDLPRPAGFEEANCHVMVPEAGLARLLEPRFENGLGGWRDGGVIQGIYPDVSVLELTRRLIEQNPMWRLPAMNRQLVEGALHPERIDALHRELGEEWRRYSSDIAGKKSAEMGAAHRVTLPITTPFDEAGFQGDDEHIRTRLGAEGARLQFTHEVFGPFGVPITGITLPAHWSKGLETREPIVPSIEEEGIRLSVDTRSFFYSATGLVREGKV